MTTPAHTDAHHLITRGRGHAVLHSSGHHPNFPTKLAGAIAASAFLFGSGVLIAEAISSDGFSTPNEPHQQQQEHGG